METGTGKKMVSKGRYALNMGSKFTLSSFGVIVCLIGGFCILCTLGLLGLLGVGFTQSDFNRSDIPLVVVVMLIMGGMSAALLYFGVSAVKEAKEVDAGVPLTRANTKDLPAPDTLVRASSEPMQAQQAVLLRAAQGVETPPEQLVRASESQE